MRREDEDARLVVRDGAEDAEGAGGVKEDEGEGNEEEVDGMR